MNKLVYDNLERILKYLNKRMHIKLYALVYDEQKTLVETIRIKKTVPNGEEAVSTTCQDTLQTIKNVFDELKIDANQVGSTYDEIKNFTNQMWYEQQHQKDASRDEKLTMPLLDNKDEQIVSIESHIIDNRILYVNQVFFQSDASIYSVVYILEMRNVENEIRQLFYTKPEISFLRIILDYFFTDFFAVTQNAIKIQSDDSISRKYNEDGIQFNRRIARLFFGKIQKYLQTKTDFYHFGVGFDQEQSNEYYVNSLLERVDAISALTYENASPFGSILFMNKEVITQQAIIRFTVKFTKEDRIGLEDSKRIRKLLELTNVDMDLYLIADEKEIYGLGEVNWNMLKGELALRLDFRGLSKYNLVLVRTEVQLDNSGKLLIEDDKKVYRSNLNLIELKLIAVSFKNPRLGEEGYSSEKFIQLLKQTFWKNNLENDQFKQKVERLDQIVRKAREQKHGTMVVITDAATAKQELYQLNKQSTLIEPETINSDYIKYLTAIDGAIYFDTDGLCHAIGVILDGVAKEDIGDASRGARYNSAYRYLYKLKEDKQKQCVIVIISEDGMVDLIPESEHEDMLLALVEEIIDMINEEVPDSNKLKEKEDSLLQSRIADFDWLFNIAEVYFKNKNYVKAIQFFEYGIKQADKSYILPKYYNLLGICYYFKENYEDASRVFQLAIDSSNSIQDRHLFMGSTGMSCFSRALQLKEMKENFDTELNSAIEWFSQAIELSITESINLEVRIYDYRGKSYIQLSDVEKDSNKKKQLLEDAIADYSQLITIDPKDSIHYWNRYCAYKRLGQVKESIEDLIQAEYLKHDEKFIKNLSDLLKDMNPDLITESVEYYNNLAEQMEAPPQLVELITTYQAKVELSKQADEATAVK